MAIQSTVSCQGDMFAAHEMEQIRQNVTFADKKIELKWKFHNGRMY
jgi:hypothetical protein